MVACGGSAGDAQARTLRFSQIFMRGSIFDDFAPLYPEFVKEMTGWLDAGRIHYREEMIDGLGQAPEAFVGLLHGDNFGKRVIRVGPSELP